MKQSIIIDKLNKNISSSDINEILKISDYLISVNIDDDYDIYFDFYEHFSFFHIESNNIANINYLKSFLESNLKQKFFNLIKPNKRYILFDWIIFLNNMDNELLYKLIQLIETLPPDNSYILDLKCVNFKYYTPHSQLEYQFNIDKHNLFEFQTYINAVLKIRTLNILSE